MPFVQRSTAGQVIGTFANRQPGYAEEWLSCDNPEVTQISPEQAASDERAWRDAALAKQIWLRDRHRDQIELGMSTTLTSAQFNELLTYMQALRDWPQSEAFPGAEQRPTPPPWIARQPL